MGSTDAAADAALAAVLDEDSTDGTPADPDSSGVTTTVGAEDSMSDVGTPTEVADQGKRVFSGPAVDPDQPALCSVDEAKALVTDLRASLEQFDRTITAIMATRAWKALGYQSPSQFVLAELGPDKEDPDAPGRVSRSHAYRLARLALFLYGLAERIGDEAYALELSERTMRSIPAGRGGENDKTMLDRVEAAIGERDNYEPAEAQEIVDGVIADARQELHETGRLSEPGESQRRPSDDEALATLGTGELGQFTPDPQADHDHTETTTDPAAPEQDNQDSSAFEDSGGPPAARDPWAGEQSSSSRNAMRDAYAVEQPSDETAASALTIRTLIGVFRQMPEWEQQLPDILEYATGDELSDLVDQADTAMAIIESIHKHADELL